MASNKLSSRRRTARKPPVCHSGPAVGSILYPSNAPQRERTPLAKKLPGVTSPIVPRTGRCPPAYRTCGLNPAVWSTEVDAGDAVDHEACCPSLPQGENLDVFCSAEYGDISPGDQNTTNCEKIENFQYGAPGFPCVDTITAITTWSDGKKCTAISIVNVYEP